MHVARVINLHPFDYSTATLHTVKRRWGDLICFCEYSTAYRHYCCELIETKIILDYFAVGVIERKKGSLRKKYKCFPKLLHYGVNLPKICIVIANKKKN